MSIPTTATQLLIVLLFVVPGFVYQGVRVHLRGRRPADVDLSTRLVGAIARSAIFALAYLAIGGQLLVDAVNGTGWLIHHIRTGALIALVGGFGIPAFLALIPDDSKAVNWFRERWPAKWFTSRLQYDATPTAWDKAFQDRGPCFVRILTAEKEWIAGYYGENSYSTSFPEKHQLFLEYCYQVDEDGRVGQVIPDSEGVIVSCESAISIELIALDNPDQRTLETQSEEGQVGR
ncbi:DUF6338 family protein [Kribbella sp. CA-247076]|uniref:DUF6338 family protein n=1 Tax=Kribbella sp. CA-247076 TaxID=3239941 RepID=UPI003D936E59